MSLRWRLPSPGLALLLWVMATSACLAGWDLTPPADQNRNWGIHLTQGGSYDDNFNATENNRQSGLRYNSDVVFRANVPLERMFMGLTYDYGLTYPQDVKLGGFNESHNLVFGANYSVSPRLSINLNGNFVRSLIPELVQTQGGNPITIIQAGDYTYAIAGGSVNYSLAPRWNLQISGSWDTWKYDLPQMATNSDHEDYQSTLSVLYALDERTTVGLNYQYSVTIYSNPGTNNAANSQSHTGYFSLVRRFNPRLSLQINSGYTIRESEDGSVNTAPSEFGSLVYNYGPLNTVSFTAGYSLSQVTVGFTRQFSASQNTSFSLQLTHRLTTRLNLLVDASYVYSSFVSPIPGPPGAPAVSASATEQQLLAHLGLSYSFREWLALNVNYQYTQLTTDLPGLKYDRNQIGLGFTLTY